MVLKSCFFYILSSVIYYEVCRKNNNNYSKHDLATHTLINTLCNSCNTGTSGLPDMYTRSPRAAGRRAEGGHIRQATSACVTTIT